MRERERENERERMREREMVYKIYSISITLNQLKKSVI